MRLENRFRQAKEQQGFTNQEIVTRTGLSYATVARLCTTGGERVPFSSDTLEKLCNCFQMQPQALLVLQDEYPAPTPDSNDAEMHADNYEHACARAVDFITNRCVLGTGQSIRKLALWSGYRQWCHVWPVSGDAAPSLSHRAFDQWLRDFLGLTDKRSTGGRHVWLGIALRPVSTHQEATHLQAA